MIFNAHYVFREKATPLAVVNAWLTVEQNVIHCATIAIDFLLACL